MQSFVHVPQARSLVGLVGRRRADQFCFQHRFENFPLRRIQLIQVDALDGSTRQRRHTIAGVIAERGKKNEMHTEAGKLRDALRSIGFSVGR